MPSLFSSSDPANTSHRWLWLTVLTAALALGAAALALVLEG